MAANDVEVLGEAGRSLVAAGLVEDGARLERLGHGFQFTEGPIWHQEGKFLLFSDMPGDVRRRWSADGGVTEVRRPSNQANGMTYDAAGNLIVCEHATSRVIRERPDGTHEVLASHFQGKELNSPNDVVVARDGAVYFTDPPYGRQPGFGVVRPRQLDFCGVYRVATDGEVHLVVDREEFESPNGLCLGADERVLYVDDTTRAEIKVFEIADSGQLRHGRVFASGITGSQPGVPDGMKRDAQGNIWVTGPGGIWVFDPAGTKLGMVEVPEVAANLNWGGADWSDLYITASTSLYRLALAVSGSRSSYMD